MQYRRMCTCIYLYLLIIHLVSCAIEVVYNENGKTATEETKGYTGVTFEHHKRLDNFIKTNCLQSDFSCPPPHHSNESYPFLNLTSLLRCTQVTVT
jgi:hypothetical protein